MTAALIAAEFSKRRISVDLQGDRLKLVAARGVVTEDDLRRVREKKGELVS